MKDLILIRNILICFLVMVFAGCNTTSTVSTTGAVVTTGTAMAATPVPLSRPVHTQPGIVNTLKTQDKDTEIIFKKDTGKLDSVPDIVIRHASKPGKKEKITWTITPKRTDGRANKVIICIKNDGSRDVFKNDPDWQNGCTVSKSHKVTGIVLLESEMGSDTTLHFNYEVTNYYDHNDYIDPPGIIYK